MNDNGSGQAGDRWEKLRLLEELTREELLPELADSLITLPQGLQMVHHPLVVEIAVMPGALNRKLRDRQERLTRETDPETILWLHERPYRLTKLKEMWEDGKIDRTTLPHLLGRFWRDSEGSSDEEQDSSWIIGMFREAGFLCDIGWNPPQQPMPVWRGGLPCGMSWTLDRNVAEYFSSRFRQHARPLYQAIAPPEAVLAVFMDARAESEVVADPSLLQEVRIIRKAIP